MGLLSIREASDQMLDRIFDRTSEVISNPEQFCSQLKGKQVLQFFMENSTRTKTSFEAAVRKLGGISIGFSPGASSLSKGETFKDTVATLIQYQPDFIVIRHSSSLSPIWLQELVGPKIPVINAGDGRHEHPTQALLDAYTLGTKFGFSGRGKPQLKAKKILILGDIAHSRVARSNLHLLSRLGAELHVCAPRTLLPTHTDGFPRIEWHDRMPKLSHFDAVMVLRLQLERQKESFLPSLEEYRHFFGLTRERLQAMRSDAYILHPGPMNRGVEIDPEVADSHQSLILEQVKNGMWVRAAVLSVLSEGQK